MKANRQRFSTGSLGQAGAIGDRHTLFGIQRNHIAKRTLHVRQPNGRAKEPHIQAMLLHIFFTIFAVAARMAGIKRNLLTNGKVGNTVGNGNHGSGHFVTQDNRLTHADLADAAFIKIMNVRTANAACAHAHSNLSAFGGCDSIGFNTNILLPIQAANTGFHNLITPSRTAARSRRTAHRTPKTG